MVGKTKGFSIEYNNSDQVNCSLRSLNISITYNTNKMKWAKKSNGQWHKLFELELCERCLKDLTGVYVVFYKAKNSSLGDPRYLVLKLGQGHVKTKLLQLRKDPAMSVHRDKEPLVTWIPVPPLHLDNIEQVLSEKLEPIMEM